CLDECVVLQECSFLFPAVIGGPPTSLFFGGGQDAILPCANASPACANVSWFYLIKDKYVASGSSPRLSLDAECSLVIKNVTAEDASSFVCRLGNDPHHDEFMFLNVLTSELSPSPQYDDPERAGEVTLECSLWRHSSVLHCPPNSLRWVDEAGARLQDEGVGHRFLGQANCVSVLTVKRQSGVDRRYACLFVDGNRVAVEAGYTPDFTGTPSVTSIVNQGRCFQTKGHILKCIIW
uniref:Ig-like domain-containing protein n=1 Tax=Cyclopterus lumpus TaxID=8103 RepID=A0A8C2Z9L8_CYCLU